MKALLLSVLLLTLTPGMPAGAEEPKPTRVESIQGPGGPLSIRVFVPAKANKARSAIVLLHGGGWTEGEASWMDAIGVQYAGLGMTALSVEYRLSDRAKVTPADALADVRAAIRWARAESARLGIDPDKIAVLGTSAGGHLAAAAAVFRDANPQALSAVPNALVLRSAAVSVAGSSWFQKLTGGTQEAAALSPDLHVGAGMPPAILLQGEQDSVTPAKGASAFCDRMVAHKNICVLKLYPGVGHLFTRNLAQQEVPDYPSIDRAVVKDASVASIAFLRSQGLLD
jgi:acetyl esterase/lipase